MVQVRKKIIREFTKANIRKGKSREAETLFSIKIYLFRRSFTKDIFMEKVKSLIRRRDIRMRDSFVLVKSMGKVGKRLRLIFIKVSLVMDIDKAVENSKLFLIRIMCRPD